MSINGKRDDFELEDFIALARVAGIKKRKAMGVIEQVASALSSWLEHAETAGVPTQIASEISKKFRTDILDAK